MRHHQDLFVELVQTPPKEVVSSSTPGVASTPEKEKLARVYRLSAIDWLHSSRVYTKLFTPATFALVKRLAVDDVVVFRLLSENKFQQALWRLKDCGLEDHAQRLEDWISKYLLNTDFIRDHQDAGRWLHDHEDWSVREGRVCAGWCCACPS